MLLAYQSMDERQSKRSRQRAMQRLEDPRQRQPLSLRSRFICSVLGACHRDVRAPGCNAPMPKLKFIAGGNRIESRIISLIGRLARRTVIASSYSESALDFCITFHKWPLNSGHLQTVAGTVAISKSYPPMAASKSGHLPNVATCKAWAPSQSSHLPKAATQKRRPSKGSHLPASSRSGHFSKVAPFQRGHLPKVATFQTRQLSKSCPAPKAVTLLASLRLACFAVNLFSRCECAQHAARMKRWHFRYLRFCHRSLSGETATLIHRTLGPLLGTTFASFRRCRAM